METTTPTLTSLYDRLGKHEGITRIARSLLANHIANPLLKTRFASSDMDKVEKRAIEFICAGTGGPEAYTGKDMLTTHKGMNISEQEFVATVDDAMAALESNGIDAATRNDVLNIFWSLKGQVIRV